MVISSDGGRVVLFYRYFLPSEHVGDETLQFFQRNSTHYLVELLKHQQVGDAMTPMTLTLLAPEQIILTHTFSRPRQSLCEKHGGMKGRILISSEGING